LMRNLLLLLWMTIFEINGSDSHWNYGKEGPQYWKHHFSICSKSKQSPINIEPKKTKFSSSLTPFHLNLFRKTSTDTTIQNNGHTVQVDPNGAAWTIPRGQGGLKDSYKALQFHFHWAKKHQRGGSEHTYNGKHTWGELHVVHYNTKYKSKPALMKQPDGLGVLGFFIQNDAKHDNHAFARIVDWIRKGRYKGESAPLPNFRFSNIIKPINLKKYFRYQGSLTTPTCDQAVIWTLFKEPIHISPNQAKIFQDNLYSEERSKKSKHRESGNFRPTQPLNGRIVTRSFKTLP